MPANLIPDIRKDIYLVFSRKILEEQYSDIKSTLEKLLLKISEETDLITQDSLARGKLVEAVALYAFLKKDEKRDSWDINKDVFSYDVKEDDPPEY
ncbi:MAG: hypothetical protein ACREIQ_01770, partial [Nitrospiria bacterium]